jgi:hypothetical protein
MRQSDNTHVRSSAQHQHELSHVFWIGGTPCSGKTSAAGILAGRHELRIYHCDEAFELHKHQLLTMRDILAMSWDQIWMRPLDVMIADEFAIYQEEFAMILDDLRALPAFPPIVAEGTALLPDLVASVLGNTRQAVWVVPSPAFQRERYLRRGEWVQAILSECRDPDQAFRNWMDRDITMAQMVADNASERGLALRTVDGRASIAELADWIEQQFQTHLMRLIGEG